MIRIWRKPIRYTITYTQNCNPKCSRPYLYVRHSRIDDFRNNIILAFHIHFGNAVLRDLIIIKRVPFLYGI